MKITGKTTKREHQVEEDRRSYPQVPMVSLNDIATLRPLTWIELQRSHEPPIVALVVDSLEGWAINASTSIQALARDRRFRGSAEWSIQTFRASQVIRIIGRQEVAAPSPPDATWFARNGGGAS